MGIPADASDAIVVYAYQQQKATNPVFISQYLDCLREIGTTRNSELILTEMATEKSAGNFDSLDVHEAYRFLNFDVFNPPRDEGYIIGHFKSRLESSAPHQEGGLRQSLLTIGRHLNNQKIIAVAEDGRHIDGINVLRQHANDILSTRNLRPGASLS